MIASSSSSSQAIVARLDQDIRTALQDYKAGDQSSRSRRKAYEKKRNALYAKRKYHKKLLRIQELQTQVCAIKQQNANVQQDNQRLESILAAVRLQVATHKPPTKQELMLQEMLLVQQQRQRQKELLLQLVPALLLASPSSILLS